MQKLRVGRFFYWKVASLLLLMVTECQAQISTESNSCKQSSCIAMLAQRYFRSRSTVAVMTLGAHERHQQGSCIREDGLVRQVGLSRMFSFVVQKLSINASTCYCSDNQRELVEADYFIIIGSDVSIAKCTNAVCFGKIADPRRYYVVYLDTLYGETSLQNVLQMFWNRSQRKVLVLVKNQRESLDLYTGSTKNGILRASVIDTCDGQAFRGNSQLSRQKTTAQNPYNGFGREVKVGLVVAPPYTCDRVGGGYAGLDVEIIEAMASALNFSLVYIPTKDLKRENEEENVGWFGFHGPWKRILDSLQSGDIDIGLGGMVLAADRLDYLGYTQPYIRDRVAFYATTDMIWSQDMKALILVVILQMISVHICTSVAMHLLQWKVHRYRRKRDFGQTALMVWSILTEVSSDITNLSTRQVLLWVACAVYAINMNTVYKSFFTSVLARPLFEEKIQTVSDMIQSDLPFLQTAPISNDSTVLSLEEQSLLLSRSTNCLQPLPSCLATFLPKTHYCMNAFVFHKKFVQYVMRSRVFHVLDRQLDFYDIGIYTRKNFSLTPKMTMIIHRCAQAGLIEFWYMKTLRQRMCDLTGPTWLLLRYAYAGKPKVNKHDSYSAQALTVTQLYLQFQVLLQGLAVAGLAFFVELLTSTCRFQLILKQFKDKLSFKKFDR